MEILSLRILVVQALIVCCNIRAGLLELFPETVRQLELTDPLMPNVEKSVKDCPFSIYKHGGIVLASSIFSERYKNKTFSHTVKILNGEATCVGVIVDESHVLTVLDCASEDDPLPRVEFYNKTHPSVETVKAFRNPMYNVTVLQLESPFNVTSLMVPACFWDAPFEDGFDKIQNIFIDSNGKLGMEEWKCTLQNRQECLDAVRNLPSVVQTRAIAGARMHPMVVTFGLDEEGVALPVSQYVEWLETVTERKLTPSECATRYRDVRDFEDSMVQRSDDFQSIQYSKSRLSTTSINQFKVRILPNATDVGSKRHCYGSLIGPKFILTAASCLRRYEADSYGVEMAQRNVYYPERENRIRVRSVANKVHYHPEFNGETLANDIALLELTQPLISFNKTVTPACIWSHENLPISEFQTNGYVPFNATDDESVRTNQLYATSDILNECPQKEPPHTVCAGFPTALVPNTCHNSIGSAMSRSLYSLDRYFEYIFAINSRGENCGFNLPTVFTTIAPYVRWIDSIIFTAQVQYEDNTKYYGDRCQNGAGVEGTCVSLTQCPKLDQEARQGKTKRDVQSSVGSCSFGMQNEMTVCCTEADLLRDEAHRDQLSEVTAEIDSCPHLYHEFRKTKSPYREDNFPSYPYLVRINGNESHSCNGTLVAKQFVLTTAVCYQRLPGNNVTVYVGNTTQQTFAVKHAVMHPQYDGLSTEFNLVLLKLEALATINNETIPACLWSNQTHTPMRLQEVYANPNPSHQYRYPLFNKECRVRNAANVTDLQLCVEHDAMYYHRFMRNPMDSGNALVSHFAQGVEEHQVTYLVGLYGDERVVGQVSVDDDDDSRDDQSKVFYTVYQRISEYYHWIKHVISLESQQH